MSSDGDRRSSSATSLTGSTASLHSLVDPPASAPTEVTGSKTEPKIPRPSNIGLKTPTSLPAPGKGASKLPATAIKTPRPVSVPATTATPSAAKSVSGLKPRTALSKPSHRESTVSDSLVTPVSESSSLAEDAETLEQRTEVDVHQLPTDIPQKSASTPVQASHTPLTEQLSTFSSDRRESLKAESAKAGGDFPGRNGCLLYTF